MTATLERTVRRFTTTELRLAQAEYANSPQPIPDSVKPAWDKAVERPQQLPAQWPQLVSADIKHLSDVLAQIVSLQNEREMDEYGVLRPTTYASRLAGEIVVDAAICLASKRKQIPLGTVSSDSKGGLRIDWMADKSSVRLIVGHGLDAKSYIYHEIDDDFGADAEVTAEALAYWLHTIPTT